MKPWCFVAICLSCLAVLPSLAMPQQQALPQAVTANAAPLSLDTFLAEVAQYHPKIMAADIERRIAGAKLLEKQGAFDPGISLDSDYLRYNDFSNKGKISQTWDNDLSLQWLSRAGLKVSTGARYNTGSVKPPLYPTGEGGEYFVGLKLPVLRGFKINDKVAAERQAEIGIPLADAAYRQTRLSVLLQAANVYWQWVASVQKVVVAQQVLQLAKTRYQATEERVKLGDLPKIDGVEAEQEVQRRQGLLAKTNREYEKHVYKLSQYLWTDNGAPAPLVVPQQAPKPLPQPASWTDEDWMEGRRLALENRPELRALNLQKELTEVDLAFAKNQQLPIMDLFAYPGLDTGDKSVGATLKAGVSLVVPLRQRTAKGLVKAAQYKLQKLDLDQRIVLQQALLDVDDAYSAVGAAYTQYQAAMEEVRLAQALEDGERTRFALGDSTLFFVNQRERATAEAQMKQLDVLAEFFGAVAQFKAASGTL